MHVEDVPVGDDEDSAAGYAGALPDPPVVAQSRGGVTARAPAAVRAERRAWLILWVAFATFCAGVRGAASSPVDYVSTRRGRPGAASSATRVWSYRQPARAATEKTLLGARSDLGVGTVIWLDRSTSTVGDRLQLFDDSQHQGARTARRSSSTRMEVGRFINQHSVLLTQTERPHSVHHRRRGRHAGPGAATALVRCTTRLHRLARWRNDARAGLLWRGAHRRRQRRPRPVTVDDRPPRRSRRQRPGHRRSSTCRPAAANARL